MLRQNLWRVALVTLSFAVLGAQNPTVHHPLTVRITLARDAADHTISGRMILLLSSKPPHGAIFNPNGEEGAFLWLAAQEVQNLEPGSSVEVNGDALAFPAPLSTAPAGDYYAMALLDVDHNAAYHFTSPGDVHSKVVAIKGFDPQTNPRLELTLTERVAPPPPAQLPPNAERFDFVSPALSALWGRPIHMRGVVVLPPDYAKTKVRYPTVYWTHGFGGDEQGIEIRTVPQFSTLLNERKIPPMIFVFLDQSCATGTHEFADSVNNGPWGTALTKELIPHFERHYRMMALPRGRFVTGHSSGGWASCIQMYSAERGQRRLTRRTSIILPARISRQGQRRTCIASPTALCECWCGSGAKTWSPWSSSRSRSACSATTEASLHRSNGCSAREDRTAGRSNFSIVIPVR